MINELRDLAFAIIQPDLPRVTLRGTVFLNILGVRAGRMEADIIILGCLWAVVVLAAMGLRILGARAAAR